MATTHRPDDSIRTTTTIGLELATTDKLILDRGIVISSAESTAVRADHGSNAITVAGTIVGRNGILGLDSAIKIGAYGVVSAGDTGIQDDGVFKLQNRGIISGEYQGVAFYGSGTITNHGTITGGLDGGALSSAVYLGSTHTQAKVVNTGTIAARRDDSHAILAAEGFDVVDTVINTGLIKGKVFLSGGADFFDTTKGRVTGTIDGGEGKDTLKGGKYSDHLIGGADNDKLTGGAGSDTFEFAAGAGKDVITDFDAVGGGKKQDYLALPVGLDYSEKSAHHGRDTVLEFDDGSTITLLHVKASDFSKADIDFYEI